LEVMLNKKVLGTDFPRQSLAGFMDPDIIGILPIGILDR
jgi:hypothetical protein